MLELGYHLSFAVHGGGDSGEGLAGSVAGLLSFIETLVRLSPSDMLASVLPGVFDLQNLHPLFVHFPIALLTLFFAMDLLGSVAKRPDWRQVATALLYLGTITAGMTALAGFAAEETVAHGGDVHEIMEHHEHLAISVLSVAAVLSVWRMMGANKLSGPANVLFLLLAAILSLLLALTADLGGLMVYKYGVSVAAADKVNQAAAEAHAHGGTLEGDPAPVQDDAGVMLSPEANQQNHEARHAPAGHEHHHHAH